MALLLFKMADQLQRVTFLHGLFCFKFEKIRIHLTYPISSLVNKATPKVSILLYIQHHQLNTSVNINTPTEYIVKYMIQISSRISGSAGNSYLDNFKIIECRQKYILFVISLVLYVYFSISITINATTG